MSQTARVTILQPNQPSIDVAALLRRLAQFSLTSQEDRAFLNRYRAERRQARLSIGASDLAEACTPLTVCGVEELACSAERLGFQAIPMVTPAAGGLSVVRLERAGAPPIHLMADPLDGRAVALASPPLLQEVVRQHVLEKAVACLQARGMDVQVQHRADGEVQITGAARKPDHGQKTPARVRAEVRTNGALDIDVACVQGKGCDQIVGDLARAVGGEIASTSRKPDYFKPPIQTTPLKERERV